MKKGKSEMANTAIARKKTNRAWMKTPAGRRKLAKSLEKAREAKRQKAILRTDEEFPDDELPDYEVMKHRRSKASDNNDESASFQERMVLWHHWKILAKDYARNVLIVEVPLED